MLLLIENHFLIPLLFGMFGLMLASFVYRLVAQRDKARSKAMEALAQSLEMPFQEKDGFGLIRQLQHFDLFKPERRWLAKGRVANVMRGMVGETEVFMFDYWYTVQAGKSRKRVYQTVFFANDKNWFLPNFHLRPEKWWHKLKTKLGMDSDINFEENPEFSEKFWVKGELESLVRQQFTPELQGFLTEKPPAHLEGNNYYLLAYKPRKRLSPEETQSFFQNCCEMVRLLQQKDNTDLLNLVELNKETVVRENLKH